MSQRQSHPAAVRPVGHPEQPKPKPQPKPAKRKPADPVAALIATVAPRPGESLDSAVRRHYRLDEVRSAASSDLPAEPVASAPPLTWEQECELLRAFAIDESGRERLHDHIQQHPARAHDQWAFCAICARRKMKGGAK